MPFSDGRTTEYLIDTHTHIAPGVDDGAGSMEMSLAMLRSEAEQGAKVVFLTPHSSAFGGNRTAYTLERMRKVQEAAAHVPREYGRGKILPAQISGRGMDSDHCACGAVLPDVRDRRECQNTERNGLLCTAQFLRSGQGAGRRDPIMRAGAPAGGTGRHDGLGRASDGPPQTGAHKRRRLYPRALQGGICCRRTVAECGKAPARRGSDESSAVKHRKKTVR